MYSLAGENNINLGGCGGEEEDEEVEGKIEMDGKENGRQMEKQVLERRHREAAGMDSSHSRSLG